MNYQQGGGISGSQHGGSFVAIGSIGGSVPHIQDRLLELVQNQFLPHIQDRLLELVHALHQDLVPDQARDQDQDTVQ